MTDTSSTSTETPTSAPVMEQIDPSTLLVDTNVRTDATPDKTLIESVRDLGVLVPVVAVRTEDGVRVRYGHRRTRAAIEAGAEDARLSGDVHEILCTPEAFPDVKAKLEAKGLPLAVAEVDMIPTTEVALDQRKADQMMRLMEALEDHDDVQHVWANFDFEETA